MQSLRRLLIALVAAVALPSALYAQDRGVVAGRVTAQENGEPLAGVQIRVQGTQIGGITAQNGEYRLANVPAGQATVTANVIGRSSGSRTVTVSAGQTATVNFTLGASALTLEGVTVNVVTGQQERRVESGTNVGVINVGEMEQGAITQFTDVLQGRVAGVNMQGATGQIGSGQRIRIRGANSLSLSNDPLIYVDGVLASNGRGGISLGGQDYSRLNDINPEDIENIEVLKGPAASAIYGTAAANGVILITTRRGRVGAPVWRAYAELGQVSDENQYPSNYAALTAHDPTGPVQFPTGVNQGILYIRQLFGGGAPYSACPNYAAAIPAGATIGGLTRCQQDVFLEFNPFEDPRTTIFRTGHTNRLGMSVSGGAESLSYYLSADRQTEAGVLAPNDLERVSLRTNLNARVGSNANVAVNASYITSTLNRLSSDNSVFSPMINLFLGPAQYFEGLGTDSLQSPGLRPGAYFGYNYADQQLVTADQDLDRFIIGSNANYRPMPWLSLNGNVGLDFYSRYDQQTQVPDVLPLAAIYLLGFRDSYRGNSYQWTTNASAVGTFDLSPAIVSTTTLGGSFQRSTFEQINCFGAGIPAGTRSCAATTSLFAVNETYNDERTLGAYVRQQFALNDRFFVAGVLRADNNSGLVSGLIYYPSANASWLLSEEPFFPRASFLSQLRLRAGIGQSGQRPGFGQAETFFASSAVQRGGVESPALVLSTTGNVGLKPERTTEYEAGFDVGLFSDRLSADFTYYNRRSEDALISRNLAPSAGLTGAVFENLGSVRNWGTEVGLSANVIEREAVRFNMRLTATTLRNRIEELGEGIAPISFNRGAQVHRNDFPLGAFFATPIRYDDANGDGLLNRNEVFVDSSKFTQVRNPVTGEMETLPLAYVGPAMPTNTQGLSGELTLFRNFTFTSLFERRGGNRQLNYTEYFRCRTQGQTAPYYSQCSALANPNASLDEQAAYIGAQFIGATPYGYIEDASFIKWREASVRLGVPDALSNRIRALRGASVTFSGRNLVTWTDYTGLDPEINEGGGGANFSQNEFNTQPPVRVYSVRFDFNF
jgi:TonB-linked SusC/RagA family outer membrane protein